MNWKMPIGCKGVLLYSNNAFEINAKCIPIAIDALRWPMGSGAVGGVGSS
jgi:hypothetical protein